MNDIKKLSKLLESIENAEAFAEAAEYADSSEFTEDLDTIADLIQKALMITSKKEFFKYLTDLERHTGAEVVDSAGELHRYLNEAHAIYEELMSEVENAD